MVIVRWTDSEGTGTWTHKDRIGEDFSNPMPEIVTCGFLWESKKSHVAVYQSHDTKNDMYDHLLRIPRHAVVSMKKVQHADDC